MRVDRLADATLSQAPGGCVPSHALSLLGAPALSPFRLERLTRAVRKLEPRIVGLRAQFVHFIETDENLGEPQLLLLNRLLTYGPREHSYSAAGSQGAAHLTVTPRIGTVSSWSSKATDIARVCGLVSIERIERGTVYFVELKDEGAASDELLRRVAPVLHDRMTESVWLGHFFPEKLFEHSPPRALRCVPLLEQGAAALEQANHAWGLALSAAEIDYLVRAFGALRRDPSDAELMMFAQANSEHCRHKIFNAHFEIDGIAQPSSLFDMIRATYAANSQGVLSAYVDNAAVLEGAAGQRFFPDDSGKYRAIEEQIDFAVKVETHNHPTAISPFEGAATGAGGEIRDEGATGIGAKPKAGLCGFTVSHLRLPSMPLPWEIDAPAPSHMASALEIMLQGPLGAAAFNNEFGRPNIAGYFRTFEQAAAADSPRLGFDKPIMIAGGLAGIRPMHVHKREVPPDSPLIVLGGPAMLIGLGGGAASSLGSGQSRAELDFASVQRANPEMERRAQEVINACCAMGRANPILLIHDVGAGGLSNAVPEAVAHSRRGGLIQLRDIPSAESALSPLEIWCNEAQERYVIALRADGLGQFRELCERERCPFAVIGYTTQVVQLCVEDSLFKNRPVDIPVEMLLGKLPRMRRNVRSCKRESTSLSTLGLDWATTLERVLKFPAVADKTFLITIADRTVGGLTARDPMVGRWQTPVADVAVTLNDYHGYRGEAMAMGERSPVAAIDPPASGRLAVAEAVLNIAAADIARLDDVRLSANWMAACGEPGEDAALYQTVRAVGAELCTALGIAIPVGKDSLSMRTKWRDASGEHAVISPVSVVISAFAKVGDARRTLIPVLDLDQPTCLLSIDLSKGKHRLGGSALAQVYTLTGGTAPDLDEPAQLTALFRALRQLKDANLVLAYHDRSDGGLMVALLEMAFASHCGLDIDLGDAADPLAAAFSEELGVVLQVPADAREAVRNILSAQGLGDACHEVAMVRADQNIVVQAKERELFRAPRVELQRIWSETSFRMKEMRDEPQCARQEFERILDADDTGLSALLSFDPGEDVSAPFIHDARPKIAILREQGVNSQVEMAAAFTRAGFDAFDVHMTDLLSGRKSLAEFAGAVACGGFSFGDVLGAGEGWAKSILFNSRARDEFMTFFNRPETFTLGVCNGCQMLAALKEIVPGAENWPRFVTNQSERYESRLGQVAIPASRSHLLLGMHGSVLPIAVAHGEGRAELTEEDAGQLDARHLIALKYVDYSGEPTNRYPANPNGSPLGLAGLCTLDGRVTALMPHPERVFRTVQNSWHPAEWQEDGGWMRLFRNARVFVG